MYPNFFQKCFFFRAVAWRKGVLCVCGGRFSCRVVKNGLWEKLIR